MVGSANSVFDDPDHLLAAFRSVEYADLLVIDRGAFRARMTSITLEHMQLSYVEEDLGRIASIRNAPGQIRFILPPAGGALICGGVRVEAGRLVTMVGGGHVYECVKAPCHWQDITLLSGYWQKTSRALAGRSMTPLLGIQSWQPAVALHQLTALHASAVRVAQHRPVKALNSASMHGLEQELIAALFECLWNAALDPPTSTALRHTDIMARFSQIVTASTNDLPTFEEICQTLGASARAVRECCHEHLGISPSRYLRLHSIRRVRRALLSATPGTVTISQLVRQHGCGEPGRFAAAYKAFYGELPSETLRRNSDDATFIHAAKV